MRTPRCGVKQLHLLGYQQRTKFEDEALDKILIGKHCNPMRAAGKIQSNRVPARLLIGFTAADVAAQLAVGKPAKITVVLRRFRDGLGE